MSKRLNTNDFFICTGGLMPAKMHTDQVVAKKANQTVLYITHVDVKTTTMVDFSCKKLMLLAALVAVLIAAIIILTGGAASLLVAAAIGGAAGAAGGSLLCGWKAAAARKWIGYATQDTLIIQGNYSLIDENKMICQLFNETIQIAPKITSWWDASLAGLSNFASEYFKCLMVGAGAAGIEVLATEGGTIFLANAARNYAWTWGKGLWLRGAMAVNSMVQDHYIQGKDIGTSTAKAAVLGGVLGPEVGTISAAGNVTGISQATGISDHNTWGQTKDEWNKADGIEGNPQQAQYHWLAKATSVSGAVSDLSAIFGWGGVSARERKAIDDIANAIRPSSPKFGRNNKNASGDLYSDVVKYVLKAMLDKYKGEEEGQGWVKAFKKKVKYLNESERAQYELFVKDGKLVDANGNLYDTSDGGTAWSGNGKSIFVMDGQGRIFASKTQLVGEFHHSSFLGGKPVASAGEITVTNGVVTEISNGSGHYQPTQELNSQVLKELSEKGIDTKGIKITGF